jgi:probable phosphoglycerate mutase
MLVIVRHGNTFGAGEAPRRIGAATDLPLTETGHAQAAALGAHFAAMGWIFARALVSPLQRTRQTAAAIIAAQAQPVPVQAAAFLREIDHGPDENRAEADVIARIGTQALAAWDEAAVPPAGWQVDAPARIAAWNALFSELMADAPPTLLVTSNGAARFALVAGGLTPPTLKLATGSYGIIRREHDGALSVTAWGVRP